MPQKKSIVNEWEDITDKPTQTTNEWEPIKDDEYETISTNPFPAKDKTNKISQFADWASTPLTDAPSRFAKEKAESFYGDTAQSRYPRLMGFFKGADEALGDVVSGLTSPVGIGLTALGLGEYGAGAKGLTRVASALRTGTKALSTIPAYHGTKTVLDPNKSAFERGLGVAEAAGGAAGMFHGPQTSTAKPKPSAFAKSAIGEVIPAAGKEQVVTGFDKSGKPILKIPEKAPVSEVDPNFRGGEGDPELDGSTPYEPAVEIPLAKEQSDVNRLFPGLKKSESRFRMSGEGMETQYPTRKESMAREKSSAEQRGARSKIKDFMKEDKGEFDPDFLTRRYPAEEPTNLGDVPEKPINLNEEALAAGSDTAKPISGFRIDDLLDSPTGMRGMFEREGVNYPQAESRFGRSMPEFGEDLTGQDLGQPDIPPRQDLPEMPHEFQQDMPAPVQEDVPGITTNEIPDNQLPVEYAFDWPDFHEDGSSERMFHVTEGPEKGSTLGESTLRKRGVPIPGDDIVSQLQNEIRTREFGEDTPNEFPTADEAYAPAGGTSVYKPEVAKELSRLMTEMIPEGEVKSAFSAAQQKYPRLTGHVNEISLDPKIESDSVGKFFGNAGSSKMAEEGLPGSTNLSSMRVVPESMLNQLPGGVANTVGHELTHVAQRLRKGGNEFGRAYSEANQGLLGYATNPFEKSARESGSRFARDVAETPSITDRIKDFMKDESGEIDPNNLFGKGRGVANFEKPDTRRVLTDNDKPILERYLQLKSIYNKLGDSMPQEQMVEWAQLHNELKNTKINEPITIRPYKDERFPAEEPEFTTYILPDGKRVALSTSATKGAPTTSFQLKGGEIVEATKAPEGTSSFGNPKSKFSNFMKDESGEIRFGQQFPGSRVEAVEQAKNQRAPGRNLLTEENLSSNLPIEERVQEPLPEQSMFSKVMDFPKGTMSVDLPFMTSAAFRQAKPLAWSGEWFKAWGKAAQAYGSEAAAKTIDQDIMSSKYFKPRYKPSYDTKGNIKGYKEMPSIAETNGVKLTGDHFTAREEVNRSQLAEKLPGPWGDLVKRSNRAYGAFLNHLRKTKFEELMDQTKWSGAENDASIAKMLGEFVNDATGRGSLKWEGPGGRKANLERYAPALQNALWSPRLIASNTKFLNPFTYTNLPPPVRQQYINSALRMAITWAGFAGLAQMAGADVNLDPTNSDFGKIRVGDMRIDPAGGLQQLIVFAARELPKAAGEMTGSKTGAFTSSSTGKTKEFGKGAFPMDRASVAEDFTTSKLNPMYKLAYDLMRASDKRPVHLGDRAVQMALPIMAQDLMDVMKKDPDLAKMLGMSLSSSAGMGTSFYGKGEKFNEPMFTDELEGLTGMPPRSLAGTVGKF